MAAVEGRGPRDGPNTSASTYLSATGSPNFSGSCAHNPSTIPLRTPVASASLPRHIAALVEVIVRSTPAWPTEHRTAMSTAPAQAAAIPQLAHLQRHGAHIARV